MVRKLLAIRLVAGASMLVIQCGTATKPVVASGNAGSSPVVAVLPGGESRAIRYEVCYCKTWGVDANRTFRQDAADAVRQAITLADAPPASRPELRQAVTDDTQFLAEFLRRWLGPVQLLSVGTRKEDDKDFIYAHWKRTDAKRDIYLREGAIDNQIVIPLPEGTTNDPQAFQAFLESIFGNQRSGMVAGFYLKLWEAPANPEILGEGTGWIDGPAFFAPGYGFGLVAVRLSGRDYLLLNAGKRLAGHYPESAITVAERFPALAEQVKSWDRAKIMKELGQYDSHYTTSHDRELLRELVRRGLQDGDLRALLGLNEGPAKQFQWLGSPTSTAAILTTLVEAGQTRRYRAIIREAAIVPWDPAEGARTHISQTALEVLAKDDGISFVPEVLSLLMTKPLSLSPVPTKGYPISLQRTLIRYVAARADSEDVANRLLLIPMSEPEDAGFRDLAVAQIRQRACQKDNPDAQCK